MKLQLRNKTVVFIDYSRTYPARTEALVVADCNTHVMVLTAAGVVRTMKKTVIALAPSTQQNRS